METKKNVMNDMRLLARLYQVVKETAECQTAEDMFVRKKFPALEKAIEFVTKEEERLKQGTKQHLYYLILNAHEIIVSHHLSMDNDERAEEIEKFQRVFKLKKSTLFGDAIYAIHMNRQEKLRMPEEQADEEDIKALQTFICETIKKHSSPFEMFGQHEFVNLRDSICSRLTLFNARRGGEPARLTIKQYLDAKSGRWINQKKVKQLDAWEKDLFKSMLVTYQAGKGTHLVDDLIPNDCVKGLDLLVDSDIRKKAGIPSGNVFIFANTQGSTFHVSGWDAINKMCLGAKVKKPELLTATKQRHRISTLYSALDVPESEREYFYKHMGHSKAVNLGTYQYPLPVMAVTKVGRHLQAIDKASTTSVTSKQESDDDETNTINREMQQTSEDKNDDKNDMPSQNVSSGREYFKWTKEESEEIKKDFKEWIMLPVGNSLPSTQELLQYMESKPRRYNCKQLRTKLMNEQNKTQNLAKKRITKMMDN